MTAHTTGAVLNDRRRKAAQRRLPFDLIILIALLAALYAGAWMALDTAPPPSPEPSQPMQHEAPSPVPAEPPALDQQAAAPGPRALRRSAPLGAYEAPQSEAERDPFDGVERLSAEDLDRISQAR